MRKERRGGKRKEKREKRRKEKREKSVCGCRLALFRCLNAPLTDRRIRGRKAAPNLNLRTLLPRRSLVLTSSTAGGATALASTALASTALATTALTELAFVLTELALYKPTNPSGGGGNSTPRQNGHPEGHCFRQEAHMTCSLTLPTGNA